MKPAVVHSTWIVLLHVLINVVHGVAHAKLHIGLNSSDKVFVLVVVLVSPFLALAALFGRQLKLGLILLAVSMGCSLVFGLCKHYFLPGPDRIGGQPPDLWGHLFVITAVLLALIECLGMLVGVHFLRSFTASSRSPS